MKQKKIVIIMAGILAAAAAMTGCAEQNKTATQVDYTQNAQGKSEQAKQKTAEKSQPDKKQVNKSTSGGKENSNQTADKKTKVFASSNNAGDVQNSGNDADNTDDSQNTDIHRIHTWTIIHLKIMAQQATVAIKLIRQQIRR